MRGTGYVVVGAALLARAIATGAGLAAVLSVAVGVTFGALAWRIGRHPATA